MRYVEPFTFLFKQRHVTSTLLVGSVMFFIPIVGQIVLMGWLVLVHRALMAGREEVPPLTFDDFSRLLNLGVGPFLVQLLLGLILTMIMMPLMFIPMFGAGLVAPFMARGGSEELAPFVFLGVFGLMFVVSIVVSILSSMVIKAATIRAELNPSTSEALGAISWSYLRDFVKVAKGELFWSALALGMGSMVLMMSGMLALYLGIFPAAVITSAAGAHFRAQVYSAYLAKGGRPLPIQPIEGEGQTASPGAPLPYGGFAPGPR